MSGLFQPVKDFMMQFNNPIIPGFYPDPSICRVGDDYYLVTSTFEYFPGVPVFHSRDLINWRCLGHCLTRPSQLPLDNIHCSGGIYAPTIRHHNGTFYMVTTNVGKGGNFYVHTTDPAGEWSDPIFVDQSGIDPSLFFDDDGRVYITGTGNGGIQQSELDIATGKRLTEPRIIWPGTGGRWPEAPHMYKIGGVYYLMIAEGGTEYGHMETIARSDDPWGPFEPCPHNPILTNRNAGWNQVQGTGHADLVQAPDGSWWLVFLAFRTVKGQFHHLGRETFLAPVTWTADGWPLVGTDGTASLAMEAENLPSPHPWPAEPARDDFDAPKLAFCWNFLRNPDAGAWSLTERPGHLRLHGLPETLNENVSPAFIGRRQQHLSCKAATLLDFEPQSEGNEAGLAVLMNSNHHYEVAIKRQDGEKSVIVRRRIGDLTAIVADIPAKAGPQTLEIHADEAEYSFLCGGLLLATGATRYLTSEVAGGFTGVYIGMYATGNGERCSAPADFDWFSYEAL